MSNYTLPVDLNYSVPGLRVPSRTLFGNVQDFRTDNVSAACYNWCTEQSFNVTQNVATEVMITLIILFISLSVAMFIRKNTDKLVIRHNTEKYKIDIMFNGIIYFVMLTLLGLTLWYLYA